MQAKAASIRWEPLWDVTTTRARPQAEACYPSMDLENASDSMLVAAFLEGQPEAFDVIFERHRRNVFQLCYRFTGNHEDASDLTQDVFVRALKSLQAFKGDSSLGTWLYRVAVNACLNRMAVKRVNHEPIELGEHVDQQATNQLDEVVRQERARALEQAIQKLPPKQRVTLVLRIYQELRHEEIAKVLNCSVGAVKANVFHALGNLKRSMQP